MAVDTALSLNRRLAVHLRKASLVVAAILWMPCLVAEATAVATPPAGTEVTSETTTDAARAEREEMTERWGVEVVALRRTAAGRMLDFRYRVVDAEKAAPLFVRQTKPRLIHQASGKVLGVPETAKLGPLRNSNMPKQDRVYWLFFGNPGLVQAGDKVTVAIGDFRAADLTVE